MKDNRVRPYRIALAVLFAIASLGWAVAFGGSTGSQAQSAGTYCEPPCTCVCPSLTPTPTAMPTSAPVPDGWPVQAIIIGHVTDAHVGGSYIYKIRLTEALQNIGRRADLIVDSGDCTENGYSSQWTDYLTAIRSAQAPMRVVPGNHDSTWPAAIGAMRWYLDIKGYRIIGINGREGLDRAWLEPLLAAGLPTILVRHQPLVEDEALAWLCRRYNVLAFLSGQLHQNVLKQVGAVTVVVGARVATGNYRLVAIREDQVTVEWH